MKKMSDQIVFFGSGPVAAMSLRLLSEWCNIELIITKRKPPHHKDPAPIEELAIEKGIKLLYANNKDELDILINQIRPKSALGLVIDYGVIINTRTIEYFKKGIINSHFSLLPEWRGADPITYSLLSGQQKTGVTLMLIDARLDTGDIISSQSIKIMINETSSTLTKKLVKLSNSQLKAVLPKYINGQVMPQPQSLGHRLIATYSRKLTKKDSLIDINKPATIIEREIRAYNEWPKSRIKYNGMWLTITNATVTQISSRPGILTVNNNRLILGCKNSSLQINELQPAGKNKMSARSFINGYSYLLK